MIREAIETDIPAIVDMGRRFFAVSGFNDIAIWDDDSFAATARRLIQSDDGILLVVDDQGVTGMVGVVLFPFYFNSSHRTAQELFWWDGVALLETLERRVSEQGGGSLIMSNLEGLRSGALARFYRARGYRPTENSFIKRL